MGSAAISPAEFQKIREKAGFSRSSAAKYLRVTARTIRNWEQGRTRVPFAAFQLISNRLIRPVPSRKRQGGLASAKVRRSNRAGVASDGRRPKGEGPSLTLHESPGFRPATTSGQVVDAKQHTCISLSRCGGIGGEHCLNSTPLSLTQQLRPAKPANLRKTPRSPAAKSGGAA